MKKKPRWPIVPAMIPNGPIDVDKKPCGPRTGIVTLV
jgi:hypothetical protein